MQREQMTEDASTSIAAPRSSVHDFQDLPIFDEEFVVGEKELDLTPAEIDARTTWWEQRANFVKRYRRRFNMECWSQEELLSNCILPPHFKAGQVSKRSAIAEQRSKRYYPPQLHPWEEFDSDCISESFSTAELKEPVFSSELKSIIHDTAMTDEADEHSFLKLCVLTPLEKCRLMTGRTNLITGESRGVVFMGLPDDVSVHEGHGTVSSIIEVKASHNLLIPNGVNEVCNRYKSAFDNQVEQRSKGRSIAWSRIGHPVAQLLAYMIDNAVPCGALCSASKTYFVRIKTSTTARGSTARGGSSIAVEITRAWKTCEMNYLRAWAVFFRISNESHGILSEINLRDEARKNGWELRTPLNKPRTRQHVAVAASNERDRDDNDSGGDRDDDRDDGKRDGKNSDGKMSGVKNWLGRTVGAIKRCRKRSSSGSAREKKAKGADFDGQKANCTGLPENAPTLPLIRYETPCSVGGQLDLEFEQQFVGYVDYGHLQNKKYIAESRNGVVFSAEVDGITYAVKQFDLSKNFESYKREIEAYKYLRGAWGELVPRPQFLSASLTGNVRFLGMTMGDVPMQRVSPTEVQELREKLIYDFRFRHLDNSHGRNHITVGGKLMMIDFEEWEAV